MTAMLPLAAFIPAETTFLDRGLSFLGIPILIGLAWLLSTNRKAINWKTVGWGLRSRSSLG